MGLEVQKTLGRRRSLICARCRRTRFLALQKDCRLGCAGTVAVSPVVDGYFLPDAVPAVFAAGRQNDVPTVVGFTRDESSNDLRTAVNLGAYIAAAHKHYAHRADELLDLYPAHDDAEATIMGNTAARGVVETDTRNWALSERATGNAPFYVYMISRVIPSWRTRSCSTIRRPSAPTTPPMSLLVRDTGCVKSFSDHAQLGALRQRACRQDVGLSGRVREDRRSLDRGPCLARVERWIRAIRRVRRRDRCARGKRR